MIKETHIQIKGHRTNFEYLKNLGYDVRFRKPIQVKVIDLMSGSTAIITAVCDNCGIEKKSEFRFYYEYTNGLKEDYFCNKCNTIKRKETCLQKWGVDNPMKSEKIKGKLKNNLLHKYGVEHYSKTNDFKEKYIKTFIEKWGVENPFQLEEIKEKAKSTNLQKWGVEYPQQNPEIREKTTKSFLDNFGVIRYSKTEEFKIKLKEISKEKWGVDNYSKTDEFRNKVKNTSFGKWGVDHYSKTEEFKSRVKGSRENLTKLRYENLIGDNFIIINYNDSNFEILHKECNRIFNINRDLLYTRYNLNICLCTKCLDINVGSNMELEIQDFLNSLNISYNKKDRSILNGKELDIYLPEYKLAIEINGVYWHSEIYLDKYYHIEKTIKCKEKGIQLLHIWEDDWKYKRDIVKSIILNKLNLIEDKIYARKCEIKPVGSKESNDFLEKNHIQGSCPSQVKLGLYYNNELVSLMTFGWRFTNSKREYELIRFCNKINYNIVGASSKLFSYFLKVYNNIDSIVSYSDISLFSGNLYQKLGFENIGLSNPNYFWVIEGVRKHRFNFNKRRLVKMGYDKNKSESEILHEMGYYRVFSCGQEKWIFRINEMKNYKIK